MWFSMVLGSGPLEGDFAGFPFAISAVSNPRVSKALFPLWPFRWPLCEFLTKTVTNLDGKHAHSSGPCPKVRLSRFAPVAEKKEKIEKTGSMIFVQNPLFFVQNPPAPSPKNFRSKPQNFRSKPPNFRSKPTPRGVFGCSTAIFTKCPELIPDHPQTLKNSDGPSSQPYSETRGHSRDMHLIFSC